MRPPDRSDRADNVSPPLRITGLSQEEASARQLDFDLEAEIRKEDRRFLRSAIRQSLLTTYNVDLFGIAIVLLLLGNPLATLGTLLILVINLTLNVVQQMYSKRKLTQILKDLRAQATVIRDGILHSIDPALIVEGDYLVIGSGDEFLVDGELVGSEEILVERITSVGEGQQSIMNKGDQVVAGSYCLKGHTIYQAGEAGIHRYKTAPGSKLQLLLGELTPFQRFMAVVFRILFGLVMVIGLLILADALIAGTELVSRTYQDAFSIIFGIAPTSLFFVLIITYAVGTLYISDRGALVYKAQSIEALAESSVLCISERSLVSELHVNLDPIKQPSGQESLSEKLIRRILGDFIHSIPIISTTDQMLAESLPGEPHTVTEIAPFLFENGWHGVTFNEPDLRGTFVLGLPEVLEDNLRRVQVDVEEDDEGRIVKVQTNLNRWLRRFSRKDVDRHPEPRDDATAEKSLLSTTDAGAVPAEGNKTTVKKLIDRLEILLSPMEEQRLFSTDSQSLESGLRLIFAYLPQPERLYNLREEPRIPEALIPLASLHVSESIRPEAGQTLRDLVTAGLRVKILSADSPEQTAAMAKELGLEDEAVTMVSASALDDLDEKEFGQKVQEWNVFGDLKPSQKATIIKSLRKQGERVVMVGNTVEDVPALRLADLRVALKNSDRAALGLTDIVLLKDSLEALPQVLRTGQRLINGILDVFKLYLSQTFAQLFLILSTLFFWLEEFPYHPTQAGSISLFTVVIPNIFLPVWAAAGRVTGEDIRRRLARFILPTALTTSILAWAVYSLFLNQTRNVEYAELAVTYSMLMAGWLRVLFAEPPTPFWVGGAPLRGDRRVINVVIGSILLFLFAASIPLFQELLRIAWLRSIGDYLLVTLSVAIWAFLTLAIWRSKWWNKLIDKI